MDSIIVFLANYLIFIIGLLTIYVAYTVKKRRELLLAVALAVILALDLSLVAGAFYYNPRPFVSQSIEPLISHGDDNGFPSQHTLIAMTLTTVIYFYRRRLAAVAFVLTVLVGAGRVWAHVHSWMDILGGLVLASVAGYAGFKLSRMIIARINAKQRADHH